MQNHWIYVTVVPVFLEDFFLFYSQHTQIGLCMIVIIIKGFHAMACVCLSDVDCLSD